MCGGDIVVDDSQYTAICPYCGNIQNAITESQSGVFDPEKQRVIASDAARKEKSAVSEKKANWESRLTGIDIEIQKRHDENRACVLKAQMIETRYYVKLLVAAGLTLPFILFAVFLPGMRIFSLAVIALILIWIAVNTKNKMDTQELLAEFGRTNEKFDTRTDPLLASPKIRAAKGKRLRNIISENDAYVEKLRVEAEDVRRRVDIFSDYLRLGESDIAECMYALRSTEAGIPMPVDSRVRNVRDKALAEMKTVKYGSSDTYKK